MLRTRPGPTGNLAAAALVLLLLLVGAPPSRSQVTGEPAVPALAVVPQLSRDLSKPVAPLEAPAVTLDQVRPPEPVEALRQPPPSATNNGITLTSLHDGVVLTPGEPPFVVVEGRVEDQPGSAVWLVVNDRRIATRVHDGRFRQALPLLEPSIVVWAETRTDEGKLDRWSRPVTVQAASPIASGVVLTMEWPRDAGDLRVEVSATWRERPDRPSGPVGAVPLKAFRAGPDSRLPEIFLADDLKPGVYTFRLHFETDGTASGARATFHTAETGTLRIRERRVDSLSGAGTVVLARVLLPQGIHWEQDEWFSGRSESGQIVTKFRFPEAIVWSERKADVE